MSYYKRASIKMHREFDTKEADMLLAYGVLTEVEHKERIANITNRTGRNCDVCLSAKKSK